ncbi:MAG: hypothetical protein ACOWWM_13495 [Desulfobacterales bacterium]
MGTDFIHVFTKKRRPFAPRTRLNAGFWTASTIPDRINQRDAVRRILLRPGGPSEAAIRFRGKATASPSGLLQRAVRSISCPNPTGRVRDIVGDNPLTTVQTADAMAIRFLDNAIAELAHGQARVRSGEPPAWPTTSDSLAAGLRNRFAIEAADPEVWTSTSRHTRSGSPTVTLLLTRLRHTREVLAGGRIRYRCLERPPCPPMSLPGEVVLGIWAAAEAGGDEIFLCEGFWRRETTDALRALTLIHEAFHVYFGGIDQGRNMWNAHCIDQFIADLNGVPVLEAFEGACA